MNVSPDAVLGAVVTVGLVLMGALWKLATMLAEVRGQVRHNGGSSLKDDARTAASEAVQARQLAEHVAGELLTFRGNQARTSAEGQQLLAQVQHDVTNIRAGQELLLHQQLKTDRRVSDHRDRNAAAVELLQAAVDQLGRDTAARDQALGDALSESLDVALAAHDASTDPTQEEPP